MPTLMKPGEITIVVAGDLGLGKSGLAYKIHKMLKEEGLNVGKLKGAAILKDTHERAVSYARDFRIKINVRMFP